MSKLEQSMGETFGAILGLHCRLCPCIEMARDRDILSNVCLTARWIHWRKRPIEIEGDLNHQRIVVT